jgi:hypothetical protein
MRRLRHCDSAGNGRLAPFRSIHLQMQRNPFSNTLQETPDAVDEGSLLFD